MNREKGRHNGDGSERGKKTNIWMYYTRWADGWQEFAIKNSWQANTDAIGEQFELYVKWRWRWNVAALRPLTSSVGRLSKFNGGSDGGAPTMRTRDIHAHRLLQSIEINFIRLPKIHLNFGHLSNFIAKRPESHSSNDSNVQGTEWRAKHPIQ